MKYYVVEVNMTKTPTGKTLHKAELRDEEGVRHEGVAMWGSNWPTVEQNSEVEGELNIQKNGKFTNKTLYPKTTYKTFQAKPSQINQAMERKETSIAKFTDRKEEAIRMAGAQRDAVLIVTTFGKDILDNDEDIKKQVEKWYKYFVGLQGSDVPF